MINESQRRAAGQIERTFLEKWPDGHVEHLRSRIPMSYPTFPGRWCTLIQVSCGEESPQNFRMGTIRIIDEGSLLVQLGESGIILDATEEGVAEAIRLVTEWINSPRVDST